MIRKMLIISIKLMADNNISIKFQQKLQLSLLFFSVNIDKMYWNIYINELRWPLN